jgi:histidyl-tRNA synthetase
MSKVKQIIIPKGAKDILPGQTGHWQYVENAFHRIAERYGFSEIRTPVLEHTELFSRGIGDTTDVVEKQMYTFEDYGGRSITLRPEGTAGVARAYLENKMYADIKPLKLWYKIACFRYEKPQSGRLREFHQFGVEIFGSDNMLADAEVISLGDEFLRGLGISDLKLKINSIGCSECRPVYRKRLMEYFSDHLTELCDTCNSRYDRNPMRIFDCKSVVCQGIAAEAPVMLDFLCGECSSDFSELQDNLGAAGVSFEIDSRIVRGLDYYTKTAFEFVSGSIGAQDAVCGGGRYDHLLKNIGGDDIPGVGFGLGIERLLMVLEAADTNFPPSFAPDVIVISVGEQAKQVSLRILGELRGGGLSAEMDDCFRNIKGQLKYADKRGAKYTLIIGDDELMSGKAKIKDMHSGEQIECGFSDIVKVIKNITKVII